MSNILSNNGDIDCLSTKLIRQSHIEDLANASEVTITFDQMTEKEAYYLLRMLRQDNAGYKVKRPRSINMKYDMTTEYIEKVLANRQKT